MSRRKKKNNQKRNQLVIGVFFILLMVVSMLAVIQGGPNDSQKIEYSNSNGKEFTLKMMYSRDGRIFYQCNINKQEFYFLNLPFELENMDFPKEMVKNSNMFIFTFNPSEDVSENTNIEYAQNYLVNDLNELGIISTRAITKESLLYDLSVIPCNETSEIPIFEFVNGQNNSIIVNGNCVIVEGDYDLFANKLRDLFLYVKLGIIV